MLGAGGELVGQGQGGEVQSRQTQKRDQAATKHSRAKHHKKKSRLEGDMARVHPLGTKVWGLQVPDSVNLCLSVSL